MAVGSNYNAIFSPQTEVLQLATKASTVAERMAIATGSWHKDMCPSAYADTANSRPVKGGGAGGASNAVGLPVAFCFARSQVVTRGFSGRLRRFCFCTMGAGATTHGVLTISELIKG